MSEQSVQGHPIEPEAIREGRFASRLIYGKAWLISWGHRRRFRAALDLAREFAGKRIFDYGCGDGTFLAMLMSSGSPPSQAIGGERTEVAIQDCRRRLAGIDGLGFVDLADATSPEHAGRYDAVFCMEVLEHALDTGMVLDHIAHLVAPSGRVIVSVPIETGLSILVKQAARRLAGLRGVSGYVGHSGYTWKELAKAVLAGPQTRIPRIILGTEKTGRYYDHKGFNWMVIHDQIRRRFNLERIVVTPFRWLPAQLGSQIWMIASKRPEAGEPRT